MQIKDIPAGTSWACKFRTTTFLDSNGEPVATPLNLQLGQAHPGTPGEYTSLGIIQTRDTEQQLVQLLDTRTNREFVVSWDNCWDLDTVEWR